MAATITFLQSASSTADLAAYTFGGVDFGAAASDRRIVVSVQSRTLNTATISSVTIGGVTATIGVSRVEADTTNNIVGVVYADVPTGTSGEVVVTFGAAMLRAAIQVFRLVGADSGHHATASSNAVPPSVTIAVPAGGSAVACAIRAGGISSATWTGLTERADSVVESQINATAASDDFASASPTLAITYTNSPGTGGAQVMAAVSFAPSVGGGASPVAHLAGALGVPGQVPVHYAF